MHVHSAWLTVNSTVHDLLEAFAQIGGDTDSRSVDSDGSLTPVRVSFSYKRETPWEVSTVSGQWTARLAELAVDAPANESIDRAVGVIASTRALAEDLVVSLEDAFGENGIDHYRTEFSLGRLLTSDSIESGVMPMSVRLSTEGTRTLVQAGNWEDLRERLTATPGDIVGITMRVAEQVASVVPGGNVVFREAEPTAMLHAMSILQHVWPVSATVLA